MCEKPVQDILPHHIQQPLCTSRLPYRQGRKLTAVKVYTINTESKHLLIFGVPSLNLRQETKSLFLKFGKLLQFNITAHPSEQFTETYHALYEQISSARIAKRMLDTKNFYGGTLHVCYAPELETIDETREKLLVRQKNVIARLKNLEKDAKNIEVDNKMVEMDNRVLETEKEINTISENSSKLYMGDVNSINTGKKPKKRKLEKHPQSYKDVKKNTCSYNLKRNPIDKSTGSQEKETIDNVKKFEITRPEKIKTIDNVKEFGTTIPETIDVIDFTSADTEILSNIDEALNYNKFGKEIIKQVPYKPVNKIKFNLNKIP